MPSMTKPEGDEVFFLSVGSAGMLFHAALGNFWFAGGLGLFALLWAWASPIVIRWRIRRAVHREFGRVIPHKVIDKTLDEIERRRER